MNKMIKRIMAMGIACSMIIAMIPQESMANANELYSQNDLAENTDESGYVVLSDVVVDSELTNNNTVNITLTNTGAFAITDWTVAYEASYEIISMENAELVLNEQVKEFKALNENNTLEAGGSVSITLEIAGTYDSNTVYRVYGLCDGVSDDFSVVDCITYDTVTGETSLLIYDNEGHLDGMQELTSTQGLDMITTDTDSLMSAIEPRTIIGSDGRTQVSNVNTAPYNKIALVIAKFGNATKQGTGFLISSRHMLTTAHMLYDPAYGVATSVEVYFGANGYTYSSKINASSWSYCTSYPSNPSLANDWGHIELPTNPGRGYFSLSASVTTSTNVTICGYPADKSIADIDASIYGRLYYMYKMSGVPSGVYSESLYYQIDTSNGQSGSPVYNNSNQVVGIHSQNGSEDSYNKGCRITQAMINGFATNGWCS